MSWIKDNIEYNKVKHIIYNGRHYFNPDRETLIAAGYVEKEFVENIDDVKRSIISDIDEYDCSTFVNEFYYNDIPVWIDKATRVGLTNAIQMLSLEGKRTIDVWLGDMKVSLPLDAATQMLCKIELYALQCYNVTAQHKNNVMELTTIDDVYNYDYTVGYPEKLHL